MPQPLVQRIADAPKDRMLWALLGVLLVGQIIAFWMLCVHQVRTAEVRHDSLRVEKMALADCMQYSSKATQQRCNMRATAQQEPPNNLLLPAEKSAAIRGAMPVNFTVR